MYVTGVGSLPSDNAYKPGTRSISRPHSKMYIFTSTTRGFRCTTIVSSSVFTLEMIYIAALVRQLPPSLFTAIVSAPCGILTTWPAPSSFSLHHFSLRVTTPIELFVNLSEHPPLYQTPHPQMSTALLGAYPKHEWLLRPN